MHGVSGWPKIRGSFPATSDWMARWVCGARAMVGWCLWLGLSVKDPATGEMAHRSTFQSGFQGFMNAFLLTGDKSYLTPWRQMLNQVNAQAKLIDGRTCIRANMANKGGTLTRPPLRTLCERVFYLTQEVEDRQWITSHRWHDFLTGQAPDYPEQRLREDLERIRARLQAMQADPTTPDTRLSDDPMKYAPCSVQSLVELTLGGVDPGHRGARCLLPCVTLIPNSAGLDCLPKWPPWSKSYLPRRLKSRWSTLTWNGLIRSSCKGAPTTSINSRPFAWPTNSRRSIPPTATLSCNQVVAERLPCRGAALRYKPTLSMPWHLR